MENHILSSTVILVIFIISNLLLLHMQTWVISSRSFHIMWIMHLEFNICKCSVLKVHGLIFSKFSFLFHLKHLHSKEVNLKFQLKRSSRFDVRSNFVHIAVAYILTGGNWQKWKRVFLTCPCHEIYRDEAVGLKSWKNTWKITIFVKMWNLGQYRENLIFCQ